MTQDWQQVAKELAEALGGICHHVVDFPTPENIAMQKHYVEKALARFHAAKKKEQSDGGKLLNCPFCGWHKPELHEAGMERYQVKCNACGACSGLSRKPIKIWNMRAKPKATQADIQKIAEIIASHSHINGSDGPGIEYIDNEIDVAKVVLTALGYEVE